MSSTPSKQDLARFFGSSDLRGSKAPTVDTGMNHGFNSLLRDGYIKNNQSLIMKIRQLEVKIRSQNRTIDELRTENTLLRRKLCDREHMADSDVVDALIKERIERKLHKLRIISTRTISYLYKAASNIEQAFEDFSAELAPDHAKTRSHGAAKQTAMNSNQSMVNSEVERTLNDVCESPLHLCAPKQLESCVNTDENDEICLRSETPKGQKHIRNECCRKESNGCHADGKDLGEYVSATQEPSVFSPHESLRLQKIHGSKRIRYAQSHFC
ncbi:hypothetical protein KIN20_033088 [Parelaphostrongylus tenuis]|uniref:Uncharacterized protein n=1 Tax=Parelaphostrongylus tenuis TaxID=148309 RepID=A0AAD5R834_PARTN|nr:hypothetical protein KIN20_033088 [Parelaphostrongylus tenuis]